MNIEISTPALLFSAITLLMLAYTNRFLALASLARNFHEQYLKNPQEHIYIQIQNFRRRLKLIKNMQLFSALSFLFCFFCMLLIFINHIFIAKIIFAFSLILMIISLILSLIEIFISVDALDIELSDISKNKKR